ncbi:ATP synthase membrane subunit K, mitochondrial [Haematobia irritans]
MAEEKAASGLGKIFNGNTVAGRANVGKATYAVIGLIIAYNMMKPKKK